MLSVGDVMYVGPSSSPSSVAGLVPSDTPTATETHPSELNSNIDSVVLFERVRVTSLRVSDIAVRSVRKGQCATMRVEVVSPLGNLPPKPEAELPFAPTVSLPLAQVVAPIHLRRTPVGLILLSAYPRPLPGNVMPSRSFNMDLSINLLPLPKAVWEFTAQIIIVNHPGTVRLSYESVLHADNVKQTTRIIAITAPVYSSKKRGLSASSISSSETAPGEVELGNGDRGLCRFRFLFRPEYLHVGSPLFLREGRIRGIGNIVDIG